MIFLAAAAGWYEHSHGNLCFISILENCDVREILYHYIAVINYGLYNYKKIAAHSVLRLLFHIHILCIKVDTMIFWWKLLWNRLPIKKYRYVLDSLELINWIIEYVYNIAGNWGSI